PRAVARSTTSPSRTTTTGSGRRLRPRTGVKADWRRFLIGMLRSRCDGFGDHPLVVVDGDRVEQLPAELCEQADGGNGLLHARPAAAGPGEHRPHQRQAGPFAGEEADDLHPPAGLAEGARDAVGGPDAAVVFGRGPQVGDEVLEVAPEA